MTVNSPSQSLPSNPAAQPSIVCLSLGWPASYFLGRYASPLVLLDGFVITTTLPQVFVLFALIFFPICISVKSVVFPRYVLGIACTYLSRSVYSSRIYWDPLWQMFSFNVLST